MSEQYLSVDLGGTSFRIALLNDIGEILFQKHHSSDLLRNPDALIAHLHDELLEIIAYAAQEKSHDIILGAALGIPGLVDPNTGVVFQSPHFPKWKDVPLLALLQNQIPIPILISNDANKAALGEAWAGAGKSLSDFILLTLGTGVGGGIIVDGKVFTGTDGLAGEFGHITIQRNGPVGALGIKGTLESYTSLSGLQLQWKSLCGNLQNTYPEDPILFLDDQAPQLPEELVRLALLGNPHAKLLWKDFGEALACGIASLANSFGIFNFIIGGGLAAAWDQFHPALTQELPQRMYEHTFRRIKIVPAALGNQAGLIGAIPMIRQASTNKSSPKVPSGSTRY